MLNEEWLHLDTGRPFPWEIYSWGIAPSDQFQFEMDTGIILCMGSANERRRYYVTPSLTGRAHTQNDSWDMLRVLCLHQNGKLTVA